MNLTFQPEGHVYRLNGIALPSVTQVIDGQLRDFSKVPLDVLERARELGTLVHAVTALDALGTLDEESVDEEVEPYLRAWRLFLSESGAKVLETEQIVHHSLYGYCGMLDHIIDLHNDLVLVDKKSGEPDDADAVQTAAYFEARKSETLMKTRLCKRAALYLRPTGRYALVYHRSKADFPTFLSALQIYKRKMQTTKELT